MEGQEINQRIYLYICITNGHRKQGGEGPGWSRGWEEGVKGGGNWGTSVILSTVKKKFYWDLSCKTL